MDASDFMHRLAAVLGTDTFTLNPLLAVILVGLTCGLVGSSVVGNRMAFFSDAMAHTAFAGIAFAYLGMIVLLGVRNARDAEQFSWVVAPVMIAVGSLAGVGIVAVRERTGLGNDTVIGVFFALSLGVGAMILPTVRKRVNVDPDQFLFGSVALTTGDDLLRLFALTLVTAGVVVWRYNGLALASFNPSLARSRGVPVRLNNYIFVVLLAVVVNVAVPTVGILLINAFLVVPAAAAANISRNLRQVFWVTLLIAVGSGIGGLYLSETLELPLGNGFSLPLSPSGTMVVVAVLIFTLSLPFAPRRPGSRE